MDFQTDKYIGDLAKRNFSVYQWMGKWLPERLFGSEYYLYHNWEHTASVMNQCHILYRDFTDMANIDSFSKGQPLEFYNHVDRHLLEVAALFHDTGFIASYNNNEGIACEYAQKHLPHFEFNKVEIDRVCDLIMATQMPYEPTNDILKQIIRDADLSILGSELFWIDNMKLKLEQDHFIKKIGLMSWLKNQYEFISKHEWQTDIAKNKWDAIKHDNLHQIDRIVNG